MSGDNGKEKKGPDGERIITPPSEAPYYPENPQKPRNRERYCLYRFEEESEAMWLAKVLGAYLVLLALFVVVMGVGTAFLGWLFGPG